MSSTSLSPGAFSSGALSSGAPSSGARSPQPPSSWAQPAQGREPDELSAVPFTISPQGPFSLAEAAAFGFGQRDGRDRDGVMRLAFCLDGYTEQAGVEVRQDAAGDVHGMAFMSPGTDPAAVQAQVARVLSLDHDAAEFVRAGERDPVIGRLQAATPGLRPPLFYSPYEAAAWSVLSARRPARQMMQVRALLSEAHGRVFPLAGQQLAAFPTPGRLLRVTSFPGVGADKIERLHGVARAALEGRLAVSALKDLGPEAAMAHVQSIKGIGPFYSALIVIRGTGFTDVLPVSEPRALALIAQLYGLAEPPSEAQFRDLAEPWRPFRTWATVLIRAAAHRVLDADRPAPLPGGE
jgi:DNA-3-methyladenine glycosylase II